MLEFEIFLTSKKLPRDERTTQGKNIKNFSAIFEFKPKCPNIPKIKFSGPNNLDKNKLTPP